jgi:hypothetical protein
VNGQPTAIVVILSGDGLKNMDTSSFFQSFSTGFTTTAGGARIDVAPEPQTAPDGTPYTCARIRGTFSGGLCMWLGDQVVGFVLTFGQGVPGTADLTSAVREAIGS